MTKICHIVDSLCFGGLERTLIDIALNLKGYEHEVWCLKDKGALAPPLERAGITVRAFGFAGKLKIAELSELTGAMKKGNFKIVHCHGLYPSIWGRLAAMAAGIPVKIAHAQSVYYWLFFRDRVKLKLLSYFTTKIIAVSEGVKKSLVEYVWINPKKVVVIHNSAPDVRAQVKIPREDIRKSLGINAYDLVVGSIGRLETRKGFEFLVEALALCKEKGKNLKCVIAGDGSLAGGLKNKARDLKVDDAVIFTGWRNDTADLIAGMDIFVLPSMSKEGLSLVLAEASSFGLPLVAAKINGNTEIITDGLNGFLIPPYDVPALADRIIFLVEHPDERRRMGENARNVWQEKFTQERMLRKIKGLYDSIV